MRPRLSWTWSAFLWLACACHPHASEESASDGGSEALCMIDGVVPNLTVTGPTLGWPWSFVAGDFDGDGAPDLVVGAPGEFRDVLSSPPGHAYVLPAAAKSADLDVLAAPLVIAGEGPSHLAGGPAQVVGDVNGDGLDDLLLGTPRRCWFDCTDECTGFCSSGPFLDYVVFGREELGELSLTDVAAGIGGFPLYPPPLDPSWEGSDRRYAPLGDLNGDGLADFAIAPMAGIADLPSEILVVFGKADGAAVDLAAVATGDGGYRIACEPGSGFGPALSAMRAAGDVNGDGLADLLVGGGGVDRRGRAYVVFGKGTTEVVYLADIVAGKGGGFALLSEDLCGPQNICSTGEAVAPAGDINGDGLADVAIGAPDIRPSASSNTRIGRAYVVLGSASTEPVTLGDLSRGLVIDGIEGAANRVGSDLGGDGRDLDGDGSPDLIVYDATGGFALVSALTPGSTIRLGDPGTTWLPSDLGAPLVIGDLDCDERSEIGFLRLTESGFVMTVELGG